MKTFALIHFLLLAYIIAALSFWWVSLERQSADLYTGEITILRADRTHTAQEIRTLEQEARIKKSKRSKQYLGEGLTFLFVILVGSFIVFSTYRLNTKLSRQQSNFMLSVTHELKSPIAAMKLSLQTLQRHRLDEERQARVLRQCIVEADRLNDLCSNILIASEVEGGKYAGETREIDMGTWLEDAVTAYETRYPGRFSLSFAQDNVVVETDAVLLQLVLNNVLENAVKYTPADSQIEIAYRQERERIHICVKDQGAGIPEEEKRKVFDKFYRIGNEDTRKTKGTGLGLYLSKKIMKQLGGDIVLKDNKPKGSVFEMQFPRTA